MYRIDGLFGNGYRIATLTKSYLTVNGIIMQNVKNNSNIPKLPIKVRTNRHIIVIEELCF